jgi:hypothetical protein
MKRDDSAITHGSDTNRWIANPAASLVFEGGRHQRCVRVAAGVAAATGPRGGS